MFTEIDKARIADGLSALMLVKADRPGVFTLKLSDRFTSPEAGVCSLGFTETSACHPLTFENGVITLEISPEEAGKFICVSQKKA